MAFEKGHQKYEQQITQVDIDRIWELFFGKKWGLSHIGREYKKEAADIASIIDTESERRWHKNHPNETNRERLIGEE